MLISCMVESQTRTGRPVFVPVWLSIVTKDISMKAFENEEA